MIGGYYAVDYQVHSLHSHDGSASVKEMCNRAIEIGLDEIGFSEHKDFDPNDPVVDFFNYDAYMQAITEARDECGDQLKIRAGVEIDYQVWFEDKIAAYLDSHEFDFVLGSVHYVNGVKVITEEYNRVRNIKSAYYDYFSAVRDSVVSGLFDVLAHLEYANRLGTAAWGDYETSAHKDELGIIFDTLVQNQLTLEINTAGIFHGIGATYPCSDSILLYGTRGGDRISIGSDAHHPDQLGGNYSKAVRACRDIGADKIVTWNRRQSTFQPLRQV
jgi:histidinol-phosphatase (PHP family)